MDKFIKKGVENYLSSYSGVPNVCWTNIIITLLNAISIGVCFFLSLYFVDTLHFDMLTAGFLMSSYGIGTVTGGILAGKLCDRISPKFISIISLILQGAAFCLLVFFQVMEFLVIILFMLGVSTYSFKTSNHVSMLSHCHDDTKLRLKTINISHAASNLGLGISGVFVGLMASHGYTSIFYMVSIMLFLSSALFFFNSNQKPQNSIEFNAITNNTSIVESNHKMLILALLSVFFVGLIIAQLGSTYPVYVKDAFPNLGTKAVSILFVLDTVLIVLFQAPLANYYGRFNKIRVMGVGAFMMGFGMLILSVSSTFLLAIISCCIWTTGEMLFIPTAQLLCYENGDSKQKGRSMGIFQSTFAASAIIGPTIGGYVYSTIDVNAMWYLSLVIGAVCLLLCMGLTKTKNRKALLI